ncbi:efflux RND transporter periplasmic adaptor subunit [Chloroflexota bacterium]
MRTWKLMTVTFLLAVVVISSFGCSSDSDEAAAAQSQEVPVERGDLTIDITATGNLAFTVTDELAFEIAGTVEEVLVEEGDTVKEGQVLARLDASEWDDHLAELEDALLKAERQVTTKERAETAAERSLATKERAVDTKKRDLLQAQLNLQTAERSLNVMTEVQEVKDEIEGLEYDLRIAQARLQEIYHSEVEGSAGYWADRITRIQTDIDEANDELDEILDDPDNRGVSITEVWLKQLDLEITRGKLTAAEEAVTVAEEDVEDAKIAIEDARVAVADALKAVADARENLDEARATSLEIIASFDGFITNVRVDGGEEIKTGTVAVDIADPDKFEAEVMVGEMDIVQVKMGGEARVQVDAIEGLTLPANITHIAPTATIQQGVVNYRVTIEILSREAIMQEQREERQQGTQELAPGQIPERLRQAIEEGRITEEEALERLKQRQSGQGGQLGEGQERPPREVPTVLPEEIQLREGLTVTVGIVVEERNGVLLVSNRAISRKGTESYVQVALPDGGVEERLIQTGISDWQFTEVTGGLGEGENVLVTVTTATGVTQQQQRAPMPFIPGGGRR